MEAGWALPEQWQQAVSARPLSNEQRSPVLPLLQGPGGLPAFASLAPASVVKGLGGKTSSCFCPSQLSSAYPAATTLVSGKESLLLRPDHAGVPSSFGFLDRPQPPALAVHLGGASGKVCGPGKFQSHLGRRLGAILHCKALTQLTGWVGGESKAVLARTGWWKRSSPKKVTSEIRCLTFFGTLPHPRPAITGHVRQLVNKRLSSCFVVLFSFLKRLGKPHWYGKSNEYICIRHRNRDSRKGWRGGKGLRETKKKNKRGGG